MSFAAAATAFALVFAAELPDKTALGCVVLATRYRPLPVFCGAAAAFTIHASLAVAAGGLLGLLPRRAVDGAAAGLFVLGAFLLLCRRPNREQPPDGAAPAAFWRAAAASFAVILVAEFGDLTQLVIASLAARSHDPLPVGIGATLALWSVAGLAITGGRALLRVLPIRVLTRLAAAVLAALAAVSLTAAISG